MSYPGPEALGQPITSIGRQARRGVLWTTSGQVGQQLLSVACTVVLARILSSSDFGIVALANSLLGLAVLVLGLGIDTAIVRRAEANQVYLSTMFWAATVLGLVAVAVLLLGSPLLASAVGSPDVAVYLAALSPIVLLNTSASVPLAVLRRRMQFARFFAAEMAGMVTYVIVQIGLALEGFGAWSVILGQLAMGVVSLISAFALAYWRPAWRFSPTLLRSELSFVSGNWTLQGVTFLTKNVDYWLVAGIFGSASLGIYYVAFVLPAIVRVRINTAAAKVLLPTFARLRDDPERFSRAYLEVVRLQVGVGFPAMLGMAVLAQPIIAVFFGDQWPGAVEPLRWLAIATMVEFIGMAAGLAAVAQGRMARLVVVALTRLSVMTTLIFLLAREFASLEAVAWAVAVTSGISLVAQHIVIGLGLRPIGAQILHMLLASFAMAGAVWLVVEQGMHENAPIVRLISGLGVGVTTYALCLGIVFRSTGLRLFASVRALAKR